MDTERAVEKSMPCVQNDSEMTQSSNIIINILIFALYGQQLILYYAIMPTLHD